MECNLPSNPSHGWRSILAGREVLRQGAGFINLFTSLVSADKTLEASSSTFVSLSPSSHRLTNLKIPMGKNLLNPLEDPPTASSSDDDELETSSGESEEEQISDPKIPSTKTVNSPSSVSAAANQDSASDSDSESESLDNFIAVRPVTAVNSKKKEGNDSPSVKLVKKRGNEGTSTEVNAKRAKKVSGDEDNKKTYFKRLWSEEDEISLLQGMIDFKAETGTSPYDDMNGFYDEVQKYISFDVSKSQFCEKIRVLEKKYFGGKKKSVESSHDKKCLELAKFIWGSNGVGLKSGVKSLVKSNKFDEKEEDEGSDVVKGDMVEEDKEVVFVGGDLDESSWFEKSFLVRSIASLGVDECSVKRKWSKVPVETKKRLEEKFKLVEAEEYELLLLKTDILNEVASVIAEAI